MAHPKPLTKRERTALEKEFTGWKFAEDGAKATVTLCFKKHVDAVVFIARLSVHAEVLHHHPELVLTNAKVKVTTKTHDAKALTQLDVELMRRLERILSPEVDKI